MSAGEYEPTMGKEEYADLFSNLNPFTSNIQALMPTLENFIGKNLGAQAQPGAFMNQFLGSVPALQGLTTAATSDLAKQQQASLNAMLQPTISGIGNELSKIGGVRSSAFPRLVGEAMAPELANLQTQLSSQRLGLFGNLAGTAMPLFAQQQQLPYQYGLQAAGIMSGLGAPEFVAPDIAYDPSTWESIGLPLLQLGTQLGAGAMGLF